MSYISTFTGKHFDFINISADDICIKDIAQGLSNECRFAGQIDQFYSVAQHSVYVSQIVPQEYALEALLHDASEAYCKDLPSPLKALLPEYKVIEKKVQKVICYKWDIPKIISGVVHYADLTMLATERRDLEVDGDNFWPILDGVPPSDLITINPLLPIQARAMFIHRYNQLSGITPEFDADLRLSSIRGHAAWGDIYSDKKKRFQDGDPIQTSRVINIDTYLTDGYIQTVNSVYRIII
ncbi:hypothetical protein C9446_11840 [Providencia heimbachae]|uniref:hypothetical protein n=1 Tax=Providencia heimbachae TaxID=333962 RepID=UPI0010BF5F57|nr:hypothetical protein C9446_11840 [Providencia heimbachae]